ncbi:MAG: SDR family oxidoreductase [Sandaracinaceae bacterium]
MRKRNETVVVAGATGYLGGHVVRAARDAGYHVRGLARDAARLGPVDESFVGQATQPETLTGLFDGASVAFSSVGVRHLRRRPTIWEVDERANLNLVDEAERAGVRRFVFVSVLGGATLRDRFPAAEARERVVDRLRASGMSYAVLRPSGFYNDMLETLSMAQRGRVWLFGDGSAELNPIHGADLADACVQAFRSETRDEADVGGPEVWSMRQIGELAFQALDRPARFGHLPLGLLSAAASMALPFHTNLHALLRMLDVFHRSPRLAPPVGTHRLLPFFERALASGEK